MSASLDRVTEHFRQTLEILNCATAEAETFTRSGASVAATRTSLQGVMALCDSMKAASVALSAALGWEKRNAAGGQ